MRQQGRQWGGEAGHQAVVAIDEASRMDHSAAHAHLTAAQAALVDKSLKLPEHLQKSLDSAISIALAG